MPKSNKKIKQLISKGSTLGELQVKQFANYDRKPAWSFSTADNELWSLFSDGVRDLFWSEILPRMQALESQTWNEIFSARKQNHKINIESLNKIAISRLRSFNMELSYILSLRITATHRLYGFVSDSAFHILWVDLNHGDNDTCVCRSKKKYT